MDAGQSHYTLTVIANLERQRQDNIEMIKQLTDALLKANDVTVSANQLRQEIRIRDSVIEDIRKQNANLRAALDIEIDRRVKARATAASGLAGASRPPSLSNERRIQ